MTVHKAKLKLLSFMMKRPVLENSSIRKGVLGNFAKFTGKHLCQSVFFNKVAGNPENMYLFKVNDRNTKEKCAICLKLPTNTPG